MSYVVFFLIALVVCVILVFLIPVFIWIAGILIVAYLIYSILSPKHKYTPKDKPHKDYRNKEFIDVEYTEREDN